VEITRVLTEPSRFYDGGVPAHDDAPEIPPDPGARARIQLLREPGMREQSFRMQRRIGYRDRELGPILVPARLDTFDTDLASVPALFTWLVPKDGAHLQAALLHDGLYAHPSYVADRPIDAIAANRVLRDAMADTGTGPVRRWLMWSAVTTATLLKGEGVAMSRAALWRYRVATSVTVLVVALLGVLATLDLLDVDTWLPQVPWMPEGGPVGELARGLAGALVLPPLLALTWGRFWSAGVIVGLGLAVLLHVTVALLAITLAYQLVERTTQRWPAVAAAVAGAVLVAAAVLFVTALV
jgi:hypothetical protein